MEGCAEGLRSAQDALQPVCALEPSRDLQQDIPRVVATARGERMPDDRRHASEGPQNRGQLAQKGALRCCSGRTKGGLNSKLHAVCDDTGKPVRLLLTEGQTSDYTGARRLLSSLPKATHMIADRGSEANWCITALKKRGSHRASRRARTERHGAATAKHATNSGTKSRSCLAGSRIKDWRRIAMRYDRCAHTFFSAICIAATVIFYLKE